MALPYSPLLPKVLFGWFSGDPDSDLMGRTGGMRLASCHWSSATVPFVREETPTAFPFLSRADPALVHDEGVGRERRDL